MQRQHAVADALASVRAEGLEPSANAIKRLDRYAKGEITATQLHQETLADVIASLNPSSSSGTEECFLFASNRMSKPKLP